MGKQNPHYQGQYLQIPALGRRADLGYLYDARTESFLEYIFKGPINEDLFVVTTQTPFTFTEMNFTNSITDKFSLFDINAKLSMSILFGLFTVEGSASYLTQEKHSARRTEGAMILKTHTVSQKLQTYYEGLKNLYNSQLLGPDRDRGTHVVTGIKWGANVAITFTDKFQESRSKEEADGDLAVAFDKLKAIFSMSGSADVTTRAYGLSENSGFSMNIYGDIQLPSEFPQSFQEIKELIKKIPESIEKSNGGKGVPLEYILTPVGHLREYLQIKMEDSNKPLYAQLDESLTFDLEFIKIFDDISAMEQRLNDMIDDLTAHAICTLDETRLELADLRSKFQNSKIRLKSTMKDTLGQVRSGQLSPNSISTVLQNYHKSEFTVDRVNSYLAKFEDPMKKIELYKTFQKSYPNIEYIGRGGSLQNKLFNQGNLSKVIYTLFMKFEFIKNDPESQWGSQSFTFLSTLYQPFNKLFLIDCDFDTSKYKDIRRPIIQQIYQGRVTIADVHADLLNSKVLPPIISKAIGRIAKLGDLYDARTDSFLGESILMPGYSTSIIIPTKNEDEEISVIPAETFKEKCRALNVDNELSFSLMAGLIPLRRSGQYLKNENGGNFQSSKNSYRSVIYSQLLEEEAININNSKFFESVAIDSLMKYPATHFVSKIKFGFNSIFSIEPSAEQKCTNLGDVHKFQEVLSRLMIGHVSQKQISNPAQFLKEEDLSKLSPSIKIWVFSDIQGEGQSETVEGTANIVRYFNSKFFPQQAEHSKGQPITYVLFPLENLRKSHGIILPTVPFRSITELSIDPAEFLSLYERISRTKLQIQSVFSAVEKYSYCVTDQDIADLNQVQNTFQKTFGNFTAEFKDAVLKFKCGSDPHDVNTLERFKNEYKKRGSFKMDGQYLPLDQISLLESKLELCKKISEFHTTVQYIGRDSSALSYLFTGQTMRSGSSPKTYLLYYKPVWMTKKENEWLRCSQIFFESLYDPDNRNHRFIVDCDFNHLHAKQVTEPSVFELKDGKLMAFVEEGKREETETSVKVLYDDLKRRLDTMEDTYKIIN